MKTDDIQLLQQSVMSLTATNALLYSQVTEYEQKMKSTVTSYSMTCEEITDLLYLTIKKYQDAGDTQAVEALTALSKEILRIFETRIISS